MNIETIKPKCNKCKSYDMKFINEKFTSYPILSWDSIEVVYKCNVCNDNIRFIKYVEPSGHIIYRNIS